MDGLPEDDASYSGNLFCIHFIQYNDESNKNNDIPLTSAWSPGRFHPWKQKYNDQWVEQWQKQQPNNSSKRLHVWRDE